VAQFGSIPELWAAQADGREKLRGIIEGIEFWDAFDWDRKAGARRRPV
jgi:hypothetical protein